MKRRKRQEQPSSVRVGAMARLRDVAPDRVPVQFIMPDGAPPHECDMDARVIAAVVRIACQEGQSLDRMMEKIILFRMQQEGEDWKADAP